MSNNELFKIGKSQLYSQDYTLVAGLTPAGSQPTPNFYVGISQPVGLVLKTSAGVGAGTARVGSIESANPAAVGAQTANVAITSTVNTDVSTYTLYWVNSTIAGSLF